MTIAMVVGSASDYPAAAALVAGARERGIGARIVAAGLPAGADASLLEPIDVQVLLGEGTPVLREGLALMGVERELLEIEPDAIVVFGAHEVGLAATLIGAKQHVPVWHCGAGRWAFETMSADDIGSPPADEDLIAVLATGLLAPTEFAATALAAARYDVRRIWVTGPLEAETLERSRERLGERAAATSRGLMPRGYVVSAIEDHTILPGHPLPIVDVSELPYLERIALLADAAVALTDGFDLQLEACLLRVPCLVASPGSPIRETRAVGAAKRCPRDTSSVALAIAEQASRTDRDWNAPPMFDADVSARVLALIQPVESVRADA